MLKEFIAINFETANAKRVSACALGYAQVLNGEILTANQFYIRPVGGHAPFQSTIHGIYETQTKDRPDFMGLFPDIKRLFAQALVGHGHFSRQVLEALKTHFNLDIEFLYIDSLSVAKQALPDLKNHKLKTLAAHFGLPDFKHHDAKEEAVACASIFLKLQSGREIEEKPVELTPAEIGFQGFIRGILSDDVVNYKEAYELMYLLEDNPSLDVKYNDLLVSLKEALADDYLDRQESIQIKSLLQGYLVEPTLKKRM